MKTNQQNEGKTSVPHSNVFKGLNHSKRVLKKRKEKEELELTTDSDARFKTVYYIQTYPIHCQDGLPYKYHSSFVASCQDFNLRTMICGMSVYSYTLYKLECVFLQPIQTPKARSVHLYTFTSLTHCIVKEPNKFNVPTCGIGLFKILIPRPLRSSLRRITRSFGFSRSNQEDYLN